jgi:hypothetical protein
VPQNITPVSRRVLIVDDNRDSADTAGLLLTALGCQVRTAYTGQAALREAEAFRPEMVLLDLSMPAMTATKPADAFELTIGGKRSSSWRSAAGTGKRTGIGAREPVLTAISPSRWIPMSCPTW